MFGWTWSPEAGQILDITMISENFHKFLNDYTTIKQLK